MHFDLLEEIIPQTEQSSSPPGDQIPVCLNKQKIRRNKIQIELCSGEFLERPVSLPAATAKIVFRGSQKYLRIHQFLGKYPWGKINAPVLEKTHVADFLDLSPFMSSEAWKNAFLFSYAFCNWLKNEIRGPPHYSQQFLFLHFRNNSGGFMAHKIGLEGEPNPRSRQPLFYFC